MAAMRRLLIILLALVVLAPGAQANPSTSPSATPSTSPSPTLNPTPIPSPSPPASSVRVDPGPGADPLPEVFARSWVLADADTGAILAEKKMDTPRRPASTLKVLTALTLLPRLDPEQTYVARKKDAEAYGSRAGIVRGKTYTIEQLMYGLLLPSGNDAAVALARANGGVAETVAQMNEVAQDLQALDTTARNPSGLDAPGQFTTAFDLTVIARAALQREDFRAYVSAYRAKIPAKGKKLRTIYNQNRLLTGGYKGAIGVKTGFTSKAGRTFIGAAERKGVTLIVTVLGSREPTADAARKLLTWGFANLDEVTPVGYLPAIPTEEEVAQDSEPVVEQVVATSSSNQSPAAAAPTATTMSSIPIGVWGWPLLVVFLIGFGLVTWRQARRRRRV
jgi:D-alanyl-D-alanine carboxypeptidase (penicillin-binding protein 5/6)